VNHPRLKRLMLASALGSKQSRHVLYAMRTCKRKRYLLACKSMGLILPLKCCNRIGFVKVTQGHLRTPVPADDVTLRGTKTGPYRLITLWASHEAAVAWFPAGASCSHQASAHVHLPKQPLTLAEPAVVHRTRPSFHEILRRIPLLCTNKLLT
jgi:hypothetical protein